MALQFVIFSLSRWNIEMGCNVKDLSLELSQNHKVLYVDVPLKRKERWLMRTKPFVKEVENRLRSGNSLAKINNNLWHYIPDEILESVNGIKNNFVFDTLNKINNKRFARAILEAVHAAGFDDYILFNDNDVYNGLYLKAQLAPKRYIYYLRDNLSAMQYWKAQAGRLEPKLIAQADLVVANSEYLAARARQYNSKSYYIGQGCDVTLFQRQPAQDQIESKRRGIRRPVVGYAGALNAERLDIPLLIDIAKRLPGISFLFVGKEDAVFNTCGLHQLSNVHFTGFQDFAELPAYLYGFDVAINPQRLNEITQGNYPRKIDEYLATGVPVVATRTLAMRPFENYVYLATGVDEFCAMIQEALKGRTTEADRLRQAFASAHTWKNNADLITTLLEKPDERP